VHLQFAQHGYVMPKWSMHQSAGFFICESNIKSIELSCYTDAYKHIYHSFVQHRLPEVCCWIRFILELEAFQCGKPCNI